VTGRISDEDISALRDRADLAVVVGDYTALRRAGTRLKGLCPFHAEKTASFTVDPTRGLFHCFGCGAGGDAYEFLMRIEALTFPEAVERLARATGYELRYLDQRPGARKALGRRTRLLQALGAAAAWYTAQLNSDEGAAARAYLQRRGVGAEAARRFGLGWAPDTWDGLVRHLQGEGFEPGEIADAGLGSPGQRGLIDRFRGRITFPIRDRSGKDVLAFGGRVLPDAPLRTAPRDGVAAKYINSPETPVYRKSETLYALDLARASIQRAGEALVVEGYLDVIALHGAGVGHAVATCGTALTPGHFRELERFAPRVLLALDADDAGVAAAERARALAEEVGIGEVGVVPLPPGQDPADLAGAGAEAVAVALKATKTAVEFQIEHALRDADVSTPEGQVAAYRRTFGLLARLEDRFLRYSYIRDLVAPAARLPADRIEAELDAHLATRTPADRVSPSGAPVAVRPGDVAGSGPPRDPQLLLEREVLLAALQHPDALPAEWGHVTAEDFRSPMAAQLFDAVASAPDGDLGAVLAALPDDDVRARVRALALSDATVLPDAGHLGELVARLRAASVKRQIDERRQRLAECSDDAGERTALLAQLRDLEQRRRDLVEGRDA
jgi:DNA primase